MTCIQVSEEIGKVVLYSHLFKNFPQFVVIHRMRISLCGPDFLFVLFSRAVMLLPKVTEHFQNIDQGPDHRLVFSVCRKVDFAKQIMKPILSTTHQLFENVNRIIVLKIG